VKLRQHKRATLGQFLDEKSTNSSRSRIPSNWRKTATGILTVARLCAQTSAKAELGRKRKKELLRKLAISEASFSKLARIGNDRRLQRRSVQNYLPPHFSIIYAISQLDDQLLEAAIKNKLISPGVTRERIENWNAGAAGQPTKPQSQNLAYYAAIHLPLAVDNKTLVLAENFLAALEADADAKISRPLDLPANERVVRRWQRAIESHRRKLVLGMRSLLRERIAKMKKKRAKHWGFIPDETDLGSSVGGLEDRIKEVLETLGFGDDEYDSLYREAEARTDDRRVRHLQQQVDEIPFRDKSTDPITATNTRQHFGSKAAKTRGPHIPGLK
jgi:hypothetical protein